MSVRALRTTTSRFTSNALMATPQLRKKATSLAADRKIDLQRIRRMTQKLQFLFEDQGIDLSSEISQDLTSVMAESRHEIEQLYPEGSFRRLFWDEQLKANKVKGKQGMRWHPLMIRWALNLKMRSGSAYHDMGEAGFIKLPSERTLRDYTHHFKETTGFQKELTDLLVKEADLKNLRPFQKNVVLLFDKMKVRESLVFDKRSEVVLGFVNLGEEEDQLAQLEKSVKSTNTRPCRQEVATHVLALMVRGVATSLRFPYAHFATSGVTSGVLTSIIWSAVQHIETAGFHVIAITADGAASNRKFFELSSASIAEANNKSFNPYSPQPSPIWLFSDVPHLTKTTRNCLLHSYPGNKSRAMHVSYGCYFYGFVNIWFLTLASWSRYNLETCDRAASTLARSIASKWPSISAKNQIAAR